MGKYYQGMRWITPVRIRMAAARAITTAQASREKRGGDFFCVCEFVLVIVLLLRRKICLCECRMEVRPASEGGRYKGQKNQERAGRTRPLQRQEKPKKAALSRPYI